MGEEIVAVGQIILFERWCVRTSATLEVLVAFNVCVCLLRRLCLHFFLLVAFPS